MPERTWTQDDVDSMAWVLLQNRTPPPHLVPKLYHPDEHFEAAVRAALYDLAILRAKELIELQVTPQERVDFIQSDDDDIHPDKH